MAEDQPKRTKQDLALLQALPLYLKIPMTVRRLRDWIDYYGEDGRGIYPAQSWYWF